MYESPITLINKGIQFSLEDEIYKAVEQIDIKVNKDELIKALKYDREQYEKGYEDAKAEQKKGDGSIMKNKYIWVVLKLGRWNHKATSMFVYDRIYKNGSQWTPFCLKTFRYVGGC